MTEAHARDVSTGYTLPSPIEAMRISGTGEAEAAMIHFRSGEVIQIEWQGEPGVLGWEGHWLASEKRLTGRLPTVQTLFWALVRLDVGEPWLGPFRYTTLNLPLIPQEFGHANPR